MNQAFTECAVEFADLVSLESPGWVLKHVKDIASSDLLNAQLSKLIYG